MIAHSGSLQGAVSSTPSAVTGLDLWSVAAAVFGISLEMEALELTSDTTDLGFHSRWRRWFFTTSQAGRKLVNVSVCLFVCTWEERGADVKVHHQTLAPVTRTKNPPHLFSC